MKFKIQIVGLLILGLSVRMVHAQQQSLHTNYLLNQFYYNPALSGSDNVLQTNLNYRNQWVGFDGAPVTFTGSLFGSLKNKMKHGLGTMLVSDRSGLTSRNGIYANYSYHVKLSDKLRMGFGVMPGLVQYRIRLYDARLADAGDDLLTGNVLSETALDLNGGIHLYHQKFFVSLSANQVFGRKVPLLNFNDQLRLHYNAIAAYTFSTKKNFDFQPSFLLRFTQGLPLQSDISLKTIYNKNIWLALTYRLDDAAAISLGYILKNRLTIAYSYDYSYTQIRKYNTGTHEVGLVYVLTAKRKSLDDKDEELNNSIMDANKKKKEKEEKEELK